MKKKLVFTYVLVIALQPVLSECWCLSSLSRVWNMAGCYSQEKPYFAFGTGLCAVLGSVYGAAKYYAAKKKNIFFERVTEQINKQKKQAIKGNRSDKAKKTKKIDKKFKYSASMMQLMRLLKYHKKHAVVLTPNPGDTSGTGEWFWNDGCYKSGDTQEYSVTYNKKTCTSKFDPKTKQWEADENNQMDYMTYYQYLVDKKKSQALKCFIAFLVNEVVNSDYDINKQNKEPIKKALTEAMIVEEAHKDEIVFCNGHNGSLDFWNDIVATLHRYLDFTKSRLMRSRFEGHKLYEKAEAVPGDFPNETDHAYTKFMKSTSLSVISTLSTGGMIESSYAAFATDHSFVKSPQILDFVKSLCNNIGLSHTDAMQRLLEKYKSLGGKLKLFFLSPEAAESLSYISKDHGYTYTNAGSRQFANGIKRSRHKNNFAKGKLALLTPKRVISAMRTNVEKNRYFMSAFNDDVFDFYNVLKRAQARLLDYSKPFFDPNERKKCGLKIYDFYANPVGKELHKKLRKEMDELVRDMLWEALEKNTLKGDAKKTKLFALYQQNVAN